MSSSGALNTGADIAEGESLTWTSGEALVWGPSAIRRSELLRRTCSIEVVVCRTCAGRMQLLAVVTKEESVVWIPSRSR